MAVPFITRRRTESTATEPGAEPAAAPAPAPDEEEESSTTVNVSVMRLYLNARPSSLLRAAERAKVGQARNAPSGASELDDVVGFESISGWAPGQLERELREGSWLVLEHENPWAVVLEGSGRGTSASYFSGGIEDEADQVGLAGA